MRPNNWEFLGDNACGNGQMYACEGGRSYMALWEFGLGITYERKVDPEWHRKRTATPFSAAAFASLLGRYYALTTDNLP